MITQKEVAWRTDRLGCSGSKVMRLARNCSIFIEALMADGGKRGGGDKKGIKTRMVVDKLIEA